MNPKKTLAAVSPDIAAMVASNSPYSAHDVSRWSTKMLLWTCLNGHEFEAKPAHMVRPTQCRICTKRELIVGVNDLATTNPALAAEIHPDSPYQATELTDRTNKKALWVCSTDPRHVWTATVASRSAGHGCGVCHGTTVVLGVNDLATASPVLASQISEDSAIKAEDVTVGSRAKPLWTCGNHKWAASVSDRSAGHGCPVCSRGGVSEIELLLRNYFPAAVFSKKVPGLSSPMRPDIRDGRLVVEYDGWYWHKDVVLEDTEKTRILLDAGYLVARVRESVVGADESLLPITHKNLIQIPYRYHRQGAELDEVVRQIVEWKDSIIQIADQP